MHSTVLYCIVKHLRWERDQVWKNIRWQCLGEFFWKRTCEFPKNGDVLYLGLSELLTRQESVICRITSTSHGHSSEVRRTSTLFDIFVLIVPKFTQDSTEVYPNNKLFHHHALTLTQTLISLQSLSEWTHQRPLTLRLKS